MFKHSGKISVQRVWEEAPHVLFGERAAGLRRVVPVDNIFFIIFKANTDAGASASRCGRNGDGTRGTAAGTVERRRVELGETHAGTGTGGISACNSSGR
jgi:hypothetical protein